MKYLILCEGPNEKKIIDILLEHGKLKVPQKHPKQFAKDNIVFNKTRYNCATKF